MARYKPMGIGAMFVLLVVCIIVLPMFVRFIDRNEPHFSISGFQDIAKKYTDVSDVSNIPSVPMNSDLYRPDKNTDYMCRGIGDTPCKEGTFCDGPTSSCINIGVGGSLDNVKGYYS
jgi:hypothetical protein